MPLSRVTPAREADVRDTERDALTSVRAMLDQPFFAEKKYDPNELFDGLLHAPRLAQKLLELGASLRSLGAVGNDGDRLPTDFVEFIAFVVFAELHQSAVERGSAFAYRRPMYNHVSRAVESGMRPEAIQALRTGDDESLTHEERQLAAFVRAVLAGDVTDETWKHMVDRIGERRTIEAASFALLDFFVCRLESAFGLVDAPDQEVDEVLEAYIERFRGKGGLSL